jgi:peroxiredoxin
MRARQLAKPATLALLALLALGALALLAAAPVPRPSPDLTIVEPDGKPMTLASFKGQVVVVEFLLTRCPHCWLLAQTVTKLQKDLGARGLKTLGVAFDADMNGPLLSDFLKRSTVNFPVGYTTSDQVDSYLGRAAQERFQVPQIVVLDRAGVIRAQSHPIGEKDLEDEAFLRKLLDGLLQEPAPAPGHP